MVSPTQLYGRDLSLPLSQRNHAWWSCQFMLPHQPWYWCTMENTVGKCSNLVIFTQGQFEFGLQGLSLPESAHPSVCNNPQLVCAITHHPFKLGLSNLVHRCKTPWLRCLVLWGNWLWLSRSNYCKFTLFWACPHHDSFKLGSLNLDQRCKTLRLRSLLLWGVIDLDLQGQI